MEIMNSGVQPSKHYIEFEKPYDHITETIRRMAYTNTGKLKKSVCITICCHRPYVRLVLTEIGLFLIFKCSTPWPLISSTKLSREFSGLDSISIRV